MSVSGKYFTQQKQARLLVFLASARGFECLITEEYEEEKQDSIAERDEALETH